MPTHHSSRRIALAIAIAGLVALADPTRAGEDGPPNRLAKESSPYLLLHARNPVDWFPWGPEAFAKAKAEGKPIFLSVGYSSCYWCHVMERESFRDPAIARLLNERYVAIKVDREQRPDVDALYMAGLAALGGPTGWPMSMFLLPDGRPFFGATYLPPHSRGETPGFDRLLTLVADAYRDERKQVEGDAELLTAAIRRSVDRSPALPGGGPVALNRTLAGSGSAALAKQFDKVHAGFGFSEDQPNRPKFPEPANLVYLIDQDRRLRGSAAAHPGPTAGLSRVVATLDRMARGGIRDQLAGGYHRYSTKRDWSVPHFEKMLYDNAQIAEVLFLAAERTGDPRWRAEAEATLAFLDRSLQGPEGGFYASLDAESEGEEGRSYVWTKDEVDRVLGDAAFRFDRAFGLDAAPNFEGGRFVLLQPEPLANVAAKRKMGVAELVRDLEKSKRTLLNVRDKRPQPARDDSVLAGWHGLALAALAEGARTTSDPATRASANRAADFAMSMLVGTDGRVLRSWRNGVAGPAGYLEDHAALARGLVLLHRATGEPHRLDQARRILDRMILDFGDADRGGFFATRGDGEPLIARPKDAIDNAIPSANGIAVRALIAAGVAAREPRYLDQAGQALAAFAPNLARYPSSSPTLLLALDEYLDARPEAEALAREPGLPFGVGMKDAADPPATVVLIDPDAIAIKPGGRARAEVRLTIAPGFHLYANPSRKAGSKPVEGEPEFPATTATFVPAGGLELATITYPPGQARTLAANGPGEVMLYEGTVTIGVEIEATADAAIGTARPTLRLRYQACDDKACLPPATLEATVVVRVER